MHRGSNYRKSEGKSISESFKLWDFLSFSNQYLGIFLRFFIFLLVFSEHLTNSAIFFLSLLVYKKYNFLSLLSHKQRYIFFPKKRRKIYCPVCVIVLWNLGWVESSLTGLNCFRKVKCKNAIRTPMHFLISASKSFKSQR